MPAPQVFLVEDDTALRRLFAIWLGRAGYDVREFDDGLSALDSLNQETPDLVLLDLMLPGIDGLETLGRIRKQQRAVPVIIVTATNQAEVAVRALKGGAEDYLVKPCDEAELVSRVRTVIESASRREAVRTRLRAEAPSNPFDQIVGRSPPMIRLFRQIERVAVTQASVSIYGESGTGKDLVARAIHAASRRSAAPFEALNCGAIAETLQDSELFGHERGAFTGAVGTRKGVFERAQGGTVFLDEVSDLSLGSQSRLLRVLQNDELTRVGGQKPIRVDVRIVSATNRDLEAEVTAGRFREDLFYRLVVYPIVVPSLRSRTEDIPELVGHFLREFAVGDRSVDDLLSAEALGAMMRHDWPGNVRELRNVVQRAMINADGARIEAGHLPAKVTGANSMALVDPEPAPSGELEVNAEPEGSLAEAEERAIVEALRASGGNVVVAARRLGVARATLYRKMRQFGIKPAYYRLD